MRTLTMVAGSAYAQASGRARATRRAGKLKNIASTGAAVIAPRGAARPAK